LLKLCQTKEQTLTIKWLTHDLTISGIWLMR
jgi:hypothetical protein